MRRVRAEIEASAYPGLPLFFTEWSTSYSPRDLIHDSYVSAPYILTKLHESKGLVQGMSYWVYTDLFEEPGPPQHPFEGGFGLLTREGIRKPAWFAYKYLHALQGNEIPTSDGQVWAAADKTGVAAVVWDFHQPDQKVSNRPFYSRLVPNQVSAPVNLQISGLEAGNYRLKVYRTGFKVNDAHSAWIAMGSPKDLSPAQLDMLQSLTRDLAESDKVIRVGADGTAKITLPMRTNDICLVQAVRT